ncbi:hypothetical protein ABFS82_13G021400 [Erythranthe guttata]|uniref:F-box domain-containing protein n=1 Tax=Erythranthe guttata TaxID=4155 RepID=A0A022QB32_ERYGU|nr:hypothetical protein MIMGU_mgv1a025112mg [Erythranthe guttata]
METRSAKRKKLSINAPITNEEEEEEDRISDLPDDVIHHIFSYLPIKSVAQTSLLSKRWSSIWRSFPDLDFTTVAALTTTTNPAAAAALTSITTPAALISSLRRRVQHHVSKDAKYADQISALIEKRHSDIRAVKFRAFVTFSTLNRLIRNSVKRNVQELDVEVFTCDYFNFPRIVMNSAALKTLRLKSWHPGFRLPPLQIMKEGLKSLSVLSLSRPILHDSPSLIDLFTNSSFPSLKKLHLEACFGMTHLKIECPALEDLCLEHNFQLHDLEISSPKLEKLRVFSCFDASSNSNISRVKIEAPLLKNIVWSYNAVTQECVLNKLTSLHEAVVGFFVPNEDLNAAKFRSVSNFLTGISCCKSLTLESQCIEIMSKNDRVSMCSFGKLKCLELSTGFEKHNNSALAGVFRSAPTVNTVTIKILGDDKAERRQWNKDLWQSPSSGEERYWESQTQYLNSFLRHLKEVRIFGFTECANDVSLVKFLLKHGKVLQQVFIFTSLSKPRDSLLREKIKSQIMGFSRASSNANIVFK